MNASTTFLETELIIRATKEVLKTITYACLVDFRKQIAYSNTSEVIAEKQLVKNRINPSLAF